MVFTKVHFPLTICITKSISLMQQLFTISSCEWQEKVDSGEVRVFNRFVTCKYILKPHDILTIDSRNAYVEPEVNNNFSISYEDEYYVVVNKPAPLPVHPCGTHRRSSLTALLAADGRELYSVNRIDSETSGLVFFAKKPVHAQPLASALKNASKMYLTAVHGKFPMHKNVSMLLGRIPEALVIKRMGAVLSGKQSDTFFRRLHYYAGSHISLVAAFPRTGRTHQIRAHLRETGHGETELGTIIAKKGFAVVGDKIYGHDEKLFLRYLKEGNSPALKKKTDGLARQFLHAARCRFLHPIIQKEIVLRAPLPYDLTAYLTTLA